MLVVCHCATPRLAKQEVELSSLQLEVSQGHQDLARKVCGRGGELERVKGVKFTGAGSSFQPGEVGCRVRVWGARGGEAQAAHGPRGLRTEAILVLACKVSLCADVHKLAAGGQPRTPGPGTKRYGGGQGCRGQGQGRKDWAGGWGGGFPGQMA
jgi:hypothetical protein